jgi:hypothetical protein
LAPLVSASLSRPPHPAPNVRDDREVPLLIEAGRREFVEMICPTGIMENFCKEDWTTQIRLNWLTKLELTHAIFRGLEAGERSRCGTKWFN